MTSPTSPYLSSTSPIMLSRGECVTSPALLPKGRRRAGRGRSPFPACFSSPLLRQPTWPRAASCVDRDRRRVEGVAPRPHPLAVWDPAVPGVKAEGLAPPAATRCCDLLDDRSLTEHRTCGEVRTAQVAQPAQKCSAANQNPQDEV